MKNDVELNAANAEYERGNRASGECRQGTGITTALGEILCRLPADHQGPHSPRPHAVAEPARLTLWQIETGLMELLEAREEADTPEAQAAVEQALTEYVTREVEKIDNIRGLIKHCDMLAYHARQEARDMERLARIWEARRDRVKDIAQSVMEATGQKRLEGRTGALKLKGNGGLQPLEVTDPAAVPDDCCRYVGWIRADVWVDILLWLSGSLKGSIAAGWCMERTVDNDRVRKVIERDGGVPGVRLGERGKHLEL